jgi:hypothetical protein
MQKIPLKYPEKLPNRSQKNTHHHVLWHNITYHAIITWQNLRIMHHELTYSSCRNAYLP